MNASETSDKRGAGRNAPLGLIAGTELPHSPECEAQLFGCVLADVAPASWALACRLGVKPKAFYDPRNQVVWEVLHALHSRGVPEVNAVTLYEELLLLGRLEECGGVAHFAEVTGRQGSTVQVRFFAEQLVLLWQLRHAVGLAGELREAALEALGSREAFCQKAGAIGQRLIRLGRREATSTLAELYDEVETEARARHEGTLDKSRWVSSGLAKFDEVCKPFGSAREDHFVVLAAGSGHGKSAFMRQVALANLLAGKVVLSFSRETSTAGFIEMLAASRLGIDLNRLEWQPKDRMAAYYAELQRARAQWADRLLFCVQNEPATPLLTVEDLCDHARAFCHLHGLPQVILVDYLQIFDTRKRVGGGSREAVVAHVSHTLQALQRELGCVMVVGVQLNEAGLAEMRQLKRDDNGKVIHRLPKPGDLRESQACYHDADRVIFLYKPPVDCRDADQTSPALVRPEIWVFQEKRRRGGIEIVRAWFEKCYTRFVLLNTEEIAAAERHTAATTGAVPKGVRTSKETFMKGEG